MINGKYICNKFMKISQSQYVWINADKFLINKTTRHDIYNDSCNIILSRGHKLTKQDIINARTGNYIIDLILSVKG